MKVESAQFGTLEVGDEDVVVFDGGLLGFPTSKRFVMIEADRPGYLWLQSIDETELSFLATHPWDFFPDYEFELDQADQDGLEISSLEDADVLCLLSIHDQADTMTVTINLLGPLVVNTATRQGRQVVLSGSDYEASEPLVAA
ncbi:MAG: flagellar assembly protein FliW [Actinomycetia bacterium]|nr:flagellar assembly protein FliW [Actinomycetes bacterium]